MTQTLADLPTPPLRTPYVSVARDVLVELLESTKPQAYAVYADHLWFRDRVAPLIEEIRQGKALITAEDWPGAQGASR